MLSEKSTAGWLVADVDLVLRENTAGWLTDKAVEQSAMFCTQHSSCMFTEVLSAFSLFVQGAPHPPQLLMSDTWTKPYSREYAAFPAAWLRGAKFWPTTGMSNLTVSKPSLLFFFAYYRTVREANRCYVQVVWTTCTGTATSSARCSRRPRWRRKQQPLLRNLVGIPVAACETASRNCNACFL